MDRRVVDAEPAGGVAAFRVKGWPSPSLAEFNQTPVRDPEDDPTQRAQ